MVSKVSFFTFISGAFEWFRPTNVSAGCLKIYYLNNAEFHGYVVKWLTHNHKYK